MRSIELSTPRSLLRFATALSSIALSLIALLLITLTGCYATPSEAATPLVRVHAAHDLDCPDQDIRIEQELTGYFKAVGCGRKAYYSAACQGLSCVVSAREGGAVIPWRDRPDPSEPHR